MLYDQDKTKKRNQNRDYDACYQSRTERNYNVAHVNANTCNSSEVGKNKMKSD